MDGLVEFEVTEGAPVLFEAVGEDAEPGGARHVNRDNDAVRASRTFEQSLGAVRSAAESALRVLRDGALKPDGVEIEFGVKMSAEVGAVITKGAAEGHLVVKLSWSSASGPAEENAAGR